jgi:hypothetical protein
LILPSLFILSISRFWSAARTLLLGQPAAILLGSLEAGLLQLVAVVDLRGEPPANVLDLLLDTVGHFLIGHLDRGIPGRLLDQHLDIHDSGERRATHAEKLLRIARRRSSLGPLGINLFLQLRRHHGRIAHDRDYPVNRVSGVAAGDRLIVPGVHAVPRGQAVRRPDAVPTE